MAQFARPTGDTAHDSLEELVAHPRLPHARNIFLREFLNLYGADPRMAHLLIEFARTLVFNVALINYSAQDPEQPQTWATVGRLKKVLQVFGAPSMRRIDNLIADLRDAGFLEAVPSRQDRRVRILAPTALAMAHDRDWLYAHYAPLAALYPERDYSLVMARDTAFQLRHRRRAMAFVPIAAGLLVTPPEVMLFFNRPGGYMFLAAILQAAQEGADGSRAAVSYADVGERFGYSRTHVRQVLSDAQAAGLVRLHSRGGHNVEILPALWAGHDKGVAIGMRLHDMIYASAVAEGATD